MNNANFKEKLYFSIARKYPRFARIEEIEAIGMVEKY